MKSNLIYILLLLFVMNSCKKKDWRDDFVGRYLCIIKYKRWQYGPDFDPIKQGYAYHSYDSTNIFHPDTFSITKGNTNANELLFKGIAFTLNGAQPYLQFNLTGAPGGYGDQLSIETDKFIFYSSYTNHYAQTGYSYTYTGSKLP